MPTWTVIDEQQAHRVESGDVLTLDPQMLGWERKPEGLCRDEICVPVPKGTPEGALEAPLLAELLRRPLVVDQAEHIAAFGASAHERADVLRSGLAPDFELPDVNGVLHRLSSYRGRKIVVYAWGSW